MSSTFSTGAASAPTSGGFVDVTFDHGDQLRVLAEASVVEGVMAQTVHGLHVGAAFQQHLHRVLAAVFTAQDQRRPEEEQSDRLVILCSVLQMTTMTTTPFYFFLYKEPGNVKLRLFCSHSCSVIGQTFLSRSKSSAG